MQAWPETADYLGRVTPGQTVEALIADAEWWTDHHVAQILQRIGPGAAEARRAIIAEARRRGITHYPPDLTGRRCPLRD